MNLPENRTIDNSASRRRIETKGGSIGHYPQRLVNFLTKIFSHPLYRSAAFLCGVSTTQGWAALPLKKNAFRSALFSFAADLSCLGRSRVPNLALAGTLELAKWDNSFVKLQNLSPAGYVLGYFLGRVGSS
jgi:hypothetical protein